MISKLCNFLFRFISDIVLWCFRSLFHAIFIKFFERPIARKSSYNLLIPNNNDNDNLSKWQAQSQYSLTNLFLNIHSNTKQHESSQDIITDLSSLLPNNGSVPPPNTVNFDPNFDYDYFYPLLPGDKRPLLSFSYAGMLWAYYLGVIAGLRDHFDLYSSQIRVSGISCGTSAALVLFLGLTIPQAFEFGLSWQKLFDKRTLKFWFLSTKETSDMILNLFDEFGVSNQQLYNSYQKWGVNSIYFGVTAIKLFPFSCQPLSLHSFKSLKELVYCGLCSMRTVPFFRTPGYYNGYYCIDGAATQYYAVPDEYFRNSTITTIENSDCNNYENKNKNENENECKDKCIKNVIDYQNMVNSSNPIEYEINKITNNISKKIENEIDKRSEIIDELCHDHVIKIGVMTNQFADIHPKSKDSFALIEWVTSGTLNDNIRRFKIGYNSVANWKTLNKLIKKGLKWKKTVKTMNEYKQQNLLEPESDIDFLENAEEWKHHIAQRIDYYENQIRKYCENRK